MKTKSFFTIAVLLLLTIPLQMCTVTKPTTTVEKEEIAILSSPVSYLVDIQPIMKEKCTPCHFPETGQKVMLDTYTATTENIAFILDRIQLPPDDPAYMPFRGKKPALTTEELQLFLSWASQEMPE